jgi:hypothetical protein
MSQPSCPSPRGYQGLSCERFLGLYNTCDADTRLQSYQYELP